MSINSSTPYLNSTVFKVGPQAENANTEDSYITVVNGTKNASSSNENLSNNYNVHLNSFHIHILYFQDLCGSSSEIKEQNEFIIEKSKIYLTSHCLGGGSYGKVIRAYYFGNEIAIKILVPKFTYFI